MTQQVSRDRWQFSGSAPEIYERYLVPAVFGPWAPILLDLASPMPGNRVLDLACGTGLVTRLAAERVGPTGRVMGLDISSAMLSLARSLPSPQGSPIEWKEGDASSLPFPESSFDLVTCQLGLQFFPDRPRARREIRRVLAPNGRLALLVWRPIQYSPGYAAMATALERHAGPDAANWMRSPFSLGDAQELRNLLQSGGFVNTTLKIGIGTVRFPSTEQFVKLYIAGTPLSTHLAGMHENAYSAMVEDVSSAVRSYIDDQGLAFPIEGHLAITRAP